MVYARNRDRYDLTFIVSGMLWRRSLVMQDKETGSLWSHILGRAMQGPLEGTQLEMIPATMTTWKAWRRDHPKTTVLNLPRTVDDYTTSFYKDPDAFVFAVVLAGQARAYSLARLAAEPIVQETIADVPILVVYDKTSTAATMHRRTLDGKTLTFRIDGDRLTDEQTQSTWDRHRAVAVDGPLKGKTLEPIPAILSYRRSWEAFHPDSTYWNEPTTPTPAKP